MVSVLGRITPERMHEGTDLMIGVSVPVGGGLKQEIAAARAETAAAEAPSEGVTRDLARAQRRGDGFARGPSVAQDRHAGSGEGRRATGALSLSNRSTGAIPDTVVWAAGSRHPGLDQAADAADHSGECARDAPQSRESGPELTM